MSEMKALKKCRCGLGKSSTCRNCSKVRMVPMLKNGNNHLKYPVDVNNKNPDKRYRNPVWYSYLKFNRYDETRIAEKMLERLLKSPKYKGAVQLVYFYKNGDRSQPFHIARL